MANHSSFVTLVIIFLLHSGATLVLACPYCPYLTPPPPTKHPIKPPHPPIVKPPHAPKPPHPPIVKPPHVPKPPIVRPPPHVPKPPVVSPPYTPTPTPSPPTPTPPPYKPPTPIVKPPPVETPCPPPPPPPLPYPPPPEKQTCPIDTLKLGACVDLLGGLVHVGIGSSTKATCCPVIQGLVGLDAALCLCTTIKAKLLNITIILPIALEVIIQCGETPPPGFKCPA